MGGSVSSRAFGAAASMVAPLAGMMVWGSGSWPQSPASATTPGSLPQSSPNPIVSGRQRPPAPPPTRIASSDAATALMINPTHTGAQPNDPLAPPLRRLWQVRLGGAVSYPLIVNGEVFVAVGNVDAYWNSAGGARVVALDANSGATLWSHAVPTTYSLANATYENGRVFVQGFSGQLIAFDAVTGTIAWSDDLSNNGQFYIWDAAPTASNGVVYTAGQASSSPSVLAIDEASGRILWRIDNLFGSGMSSPAVTASDLYETWACNDYRFSLTTHAAAWRYYQNCSGGGGASPAVLNGRVYDHLADVILNASDGSVAGHIKTAELPAFDGSTMFELINGTFSAGELRAVDPSGTVLWRFTGDGYLVTPPLVVNHVVYAGSATGILYALNESSGAVITQDWVGAQMREGAERRGIIPTAAMGAGNGLLVVPASDLLSAWTSAPAGTLPVSPPNQSPPLNGYTVTDLGTPDAAWQSHAAALNATTVAGAVTYERTISGPINHAVTWSGGTLTDDDSQLPQGAPLGAGFTGISQLGTLIGVIGTQNGGNQAFMLQSGAFTPITGMTSAKGINATDAIVGDGAANGCGRAMIWQNGTLTDLGTLGGCITSAGGINDSGQVVGEAGTQSFDHAFLWQNGSMHDLGTLGGCSSAATAINASGVVVGKSDTTGNCVAGWQAFEYVGGHMVGLGIPPGSGVSMATGISANGVIVGHGGGDFDDNVGFVVRGSGLEVLNNLIDSRFGWNIEDPAAVDDLGRIAGTGFRFGKVRAFLLTPSGTGARALPRSLGGNFSLPPWGRAGWGLIGPSVQFSNADVPGRRGRAAASRLR